MQLSSGSNIHELLTSLKDKLEFKLKTLKPWTQVGLLPIVDYMGRLHPKGHQYLFQVVGT